jgi:cell division septation protein DedD
MASEDQAGLEGQCPACGKVVTIPREGTLAPEENNQGLPTEPLDEQQGDETSMDIKGLDDLDEDLEDDVRKPPERRAWFWSSRFAVLGSIAVVVVVALIVFTLVRRDREASQELVVVKEIEPLAESQQETSTPPVGAKLEEDLSRPVEEEPFESLISEGESMGTVSTGPALETETETVSSEPALEEETQTVSEEPDEATVASIEPETPSVEPMIPVGAYTINIASFRQKENAEQYVQELKQMGIEAFDWEIDLPQKGKWHRVSVGGFSTRQEAEDYAGDLKQKGISDTFITQVPETS